MEPRPLEPRNSRGPYDCHFCTTSRRLAPASQVAIVLRGSTARETSIARCGERPVLGTASALFTSSPKVLAAFAPQLLPSVDHSASPARMLLRSPTTSGSAGTNASRL